MVNYLVDDWFMKKKDHLKFFNLKYPKLSFLVPPQGLCFKSVGNETFQDLILRTISKGHNNDYFQS